MPKKIKTTATPQAGAIRTALYCMPFVDKARPSFRVRIDNYRHCHWIMTTRKFGLRIHKYFVNTTCGQFSTMGLDLLAPAYASNSPSTGSLDRSGTTPRVRCEDSARQGQTRSSNFSRKVIKALKNAAFRT